jgi:hypothetical protein
MFDAVAPVAHGGRRAAADDVGEGAISRAF